MYNWICDVVEEQGETMNKQLGLAYIVKIRDAQDIEVPITMDFTHQNGQFYVGKPEADVAAEISLSEKDFHGLLDQDLSVSKAILQGRIKISGGVGGLKNA